MTAYALPMPPYAQTMLHHIPPKRLKQICAIWDIPLKGVRHKLRLEELIHTHPYNQFELQRIVRDHAETAKRKKQRYAKATGNDKVENDIDQIIDDQELDATYDSEIEIIHDRIIRKRRINQNNDAINVQNINVQNDDVQDDNVQHDNVQTDNVQHANVQDNIVQSTNNMDTQQTDTNIDTQQIPTEKETIGGQEIDMDEKEEYEHAEDTEHMQIQEEIRRIREFPMIISDDGYERDDEDRFRRHTTSKKTNRRKQPRQSSESNEPTDRNSRRNRNIHNYNNPERESYKQNNNNNNKIHIIINRI